GTSGRETSLKTIGHVITTAAVARLEQTKVTTPIKKVHLIPQSTIPTTSRIKCFGCREIGYR
ncbi:LOW QUALITY PROTEIN: hypothetical protein PanWU01x14_229410, partial [Parasponia andersonii]